MRKILVLAQSYYPASTSGANILRRICESLTDKYIVDVFALSSEDEDLSYDVVNNVTVFRSDCNTQISKTGNLCGRIISVLNGVFSFNILKLRYCQHEFENKIKGGQYDLVVSFCYPIVSHYIASKARDKDMSFKWIAYYFDPYFCNKQIKKGYYRRLLTEKKILKKADAVAVPSLIQPEYKKIKSNNLYAVEFPNIIDFSVTVKEKSICLEEDKIKCVFLGNLYGDIRKPESLFELIEQLNDMDIKFYFVGGAYNFEDGFIDGWKKRLGKSIEFIDRVSAESGNWILKQADILINIGNSVDNQLPGKVFDYISTGKPIISICKIRNCPSYQFLKRYPLALLLFEKNNHVCENNSVIKKFIYDNAGKEISHFEIQQLYHEYTSTNVLKQIKNIFDTVIK